MPGALAQTNIIANMLFGAISGSGAAAAAALMTTDELPQSFKILGIGLGAGKRQYERPSILRALLIEDNAQKKNL